MALQFHAPSLCVLLVYIMVLLHSCSTRVGRSIHQTVFCSAVYCWEQAQSLVKFWVMWCPFWQSAWIQMLMWKWDCSMLNYCLYCTCTCLLSWWSCTCILPMDTSFITALMRLLLDIPSSVESKRCFSTFAGHIVTDVIVPNLVWKGGRYTCTILGIC